jgi:DNA repair photolyase
MNRIREGSVCVKNPFNANLISRINIKPEVVDCIVFWTKNARPLMDKLNELDEMNYKYYFQFTITSYRNDIEKNINNKKEIIETFIELSNKIGKEKVILRYDPILITDQYNLDFHLKEFTALCEKLKEHTTKVIISFLDDYKKVSRNMKEFNVKELGNEEIKDISKKLVEIAGNHGLPIETCAEAIDLNSLGIKNAKCIDGELIEEIVNYKIMNKNKLDANRKYCGCMKCIDIGQYDSCIHKCLYCYANINKEKAESNFKLHNPKSPILVGDFHEELVKDRKDVKSYRVDSGLDGKKDVSIEQITLFD